MPDSLRKFLPNVKKDINPLLLACLQTNKKNGRNPVCYQVFFLSIFVISLPHLEIICSHSLLIYWNIQNWWDRNAGLTYSNLSWWSVCGIVCGLKTGSGWLSNLSLLFDSCLILPLDKLKKSQSFVDC